MGGEFKRGLGLEARSDCGCPGGEKGYNAANPPGLNPGQLRLILLKDPHL